ncbi:MAG TPA: NAD(P)-dependent oxidoreductase [Pyrinomonadaceae bacterium]|jgi:glutamate synthase (NADPH/NADH) small chain|nr:NAD(P)-dependent oxidoreductase [Pyrinomonadaceae bacterium]
MAEITNEQIEKNFAEINPPLSQAEAVFEANRCLYCYDAPCAHACPTHIDVPSFIKKIASGNLTGSARVIFDANPIGASCARVCPVEVLCEGACVEKTLMDKPIEIGRLQRYATDYAIETGRQIFQKGEPNGKSVGIIGSGPAGLSCATYLARLGYDVTVYERKPLAGGLDTYGMAEYKMPQKTSLDEVRQVEKLGVKFELNSEIAVMSNPPALAGEQKVSLVKVADSSDILSKHDAVFLAVGLGETNRLNIEGENLDGVMDALHFIERIKTRDWQSVPLGKTVAVIGAGNTAIDAVTQAKRLGAERVFMIYRRTERDISAYAYEYELAKKDGIEFMWETVPVAVGGDSRVETLRLQKDGLEFDINCDLVIKAIGQQKQVGLFRSIGIEFDEKGRVAVNELMQTSNPRIFAGGDCVNGGAEAVDASQMGKLAAQGIHQTLTGEKVEFAGTKVPAIIKSHAH